MAFSLVTADDLYAFSKALKLKGFKFFIDKMKIRSLERIKSQWESYTSAGSDWWDIPDVRRRWNRKITGKDDLSWEEYFVRKYLTSKDNLSMLSVGCGTGSKERVFAHFPHFKKILGADISENSLKQARTKASAYPHISYRQLDFAKDSFKGEAFDVILFYSSLHHFTHIEKLLKEKVIPLLKKDGILVMFEYAGANRFQYTRAQIDEANHCLALLPGGFRKRKDNSFKKKIYRPGWLRMWLNDPSEAPHSEDILPVLKKCLIPLEEKPVGGSILHMLLKDIAHNFTPGTPENILTLQMLFDKEDLYSDRTGQSDFWFGVYGRI